MSRSLLVAALVLVAGCATQAATPTHATAASAPVPSTAPSLSVTNGLSHPVTVSISANGHGVIMGEVDAQSTEVLVAPVRIAPGTTVTLKATTADGTATYSKDVILNGMYEWHVP